MIKDTLIERSTTRYIAINSGETGVITSKKGLGKTSVLVQLGIDSLLNDRQVVHVSFNQKTDFAITWYEDIFSEVSKKMNPADAEELKLEIMKNRIILNFNQDIISAAQIVNTLKSLSDGGIKTDCLLIDSLDFDKVTEDNLSVFKKYAKEAKLAVWFSCNCDQQLPKVLNSLDAIISLEQYPDSIHMKVVKHSNKDDADKSYKLDSKTLLILEK
jgi:hypothetical protein